MQSTPPACKAFKANPLLTDTDTDTDTGIESHKGGGGGLQTTPTCVA
jgi:hypothetical protein